MTETELQQRLITSVEAVDAPADLVHRARQGGAKRLRQRRFTAVATVTVSMVAVAGVAVAGQDLLPWRNDQVAPAGVPGLGDPYGVLMNRPTQGDLAGDQSYLDQVVSAWEKSHAKSPNQSRGIFDDLRGKPKVAWAGQTPGGKAAIIVQQSYLHNHADIQLDHEGLYTLIGFVGEGADGSPTLVADSYPAPGVGLNTGFVTGTTKKALVVVDTGQKMGWSRARVYADDGSSRQDYTVLKFDHGVSIVPVPAGTNLGAIRISRLPAVGYSDRFVLGIPWPGGENAQDPRMWQDAASWPLGAGAETLRKSAADLFSGTLDKETDQYPVSRYTSMWIAYGKTANGSQLVVGEFVLDFDPTRVYAVLKNRAGKTAVVPGGIPDKTASLPVSIRLPNGQGWAVANKGAQLSYRFDGGSWSQPRANAVLVPDGTNAEVKVSIGGAAKTVQLH
jgi:hypothetical protein